MRRTLLDMAQAAGQVFGQLKEGLFEAGLDYGLTFVNEFGAHLLGFEDVESCLAAGVNLAELFVNPNDLAQILQALESSRQLDGFVCQMYDLSHEKKWIEVTINLVEDDDGKPGGYWGVYRDLTSQREVTEEHDRLNEELLHAIKRLEHSRDVIRQTNEELELRNRDMHEYTGAVTHDLRAPIAALKGFSDMLIEEYRPSLDERGAHLLDRIRFNTIQMDRIIRGLQELVLMGEESEPRIDVDLNLIMKNALDTRQEGIDACGLKVELQEGMPHVVGHSTKIYQLLDNLLSNAMKHLTGCSEPRVRFSYGVGKDPLAYCVEDNGPGIDIIHRPRIFERFYRVDRSQPGVGLGLAIVRRVVEMYRGRVWVEESDMGGARFCFTLPEARLPEND